MNLNKASMRKESFSLQWCVRGVGAWMQKQKCDASWVVCQSQEEDTQGSVEGSRKKLELYPASSMEIQAYDRNKLLIVVLFLPSPQLLFSLLLFSFYLLLCCSFLSSFLPSFLVFFLVPFLVSVYPCILCGRGWNVCFL